LTNPVFFDPPDSRQLADCDCRSFVGQFNGISRQGVLIDEVDCSTVRLRMAVGFRGYSFVPDLKGSALRNNIIVEYDEVSIGHRPCLLHEPG
jgi:hypothetical protein